jgi:hypothetical protein
VGFGGWPPIKGGLGGVSPPYKKTGGVQGGLPPDRAILFLPRKENNIFNILPNVNLSENICLVYSINS